MKLLKILDQLKLSKLTIHYLAALVLLTLLYKDSSSVHQGVKKRAESGGDLDNLEIYKPDDIPVVGNKINSSLKSKFKSDEEFNKSSKFKNKCFCL